MKRLTILVALVSTTSAGHAQPAGAQAEVLFRHGRELLDAGKIAEACSAFQESQKLDPAMTTLVNLAGCREQNHELATAWGLFLDVERQTRAASDPASKQLHDIAAARAKALEPRVSKLTINVSDKSRVQGLEVKRDTENVDAAMWNRALPIDGGTYTIEAHAPGAQTWSTKVTVGAEADTKTIDIPDLAMLPRDLGVKTTPSPVAPASPSHAGAFVVGGAAVAALGGALAFHLWGNSTYDDAKAEMIDQARRDSLYSSANTKRYVAQGLAVGGIAAAGIAVWLYVRGGGDARPERATTLVVSPTGLALGGQF